MWCDTNQAECKQPESCQQRGCFTARVRSMKIGVPIEMSTQVKTGPSQTEPPSWEKGTAGEERPGGGFMPYINPAEGSSMGIKEGLERKHDIKRIRERQKLDPHVFD